jgi:radical SAM/Cys-rich protein
MATTSMLHQGNPLAIASTQLQVLTPGDRHAAFDATLKQHGVHDRLAPALIEILQVNVGKLCNMTCAHCHVDAGPDRREIMTRETIDACLDVVRNNPSIHTVDLTGGAPEMNPDFRYFVESVRTMGRKVIDRCNLTILLANGFEGTAEFLAQHDVEVVASLPCYLEENADAQRGDGSFQKSITALQKLNSLGYATPDSNRILTLVYNPVGSGLPPDQSELEAAYRKQLRDRF